MINKVLIGILVFLVILNGGICAYSYTLNQQINALSRQLVLFQEEQAARTTAASHDFTTFKEEAQTKIGILEDDIARTTAWVNTFEDDIARTTAWIDTFEDKMLSIATEFSQSLINANKVYETASQATVGISDGVTTVGSGFMFDDKTHAVTAQHVVERLSEIYVVLPDGRISRATIAGSCQFSDVAILTLENELIVEPPTLADSATVRIGEPVVVIGHPFNSAQTLTSGVVSQVNRLAEIQYDSQIRSVPNLIQFDAPVNFGNSGSPLFNSEGDVIGMVVGRIRPEKGDGIYYAVSANKVKRVAASLIEQGSFDYPWLGVGIANLTPQTVQERDLDAAHGVLVRDVFTESPAEASGILVDDIIVAIDGTIISDVGDFTSYLGEHKSPDEPATLTLIRDSTTLELSVTMGRRSP